MDKIGWKVVRKNPDGTFGSAVLLEAWSRPYAVGLRTTGRDDTPVLAFRTRQAARSFRPSDIKEEFPVFKARLENPRTQTEIALPWVGEGYAAFWEGCPKEVFSAPTGTLACDSITLLEPA